MKAGVSVLAVVCSMAAMAATDSAKMRYTVDAVSRTLVTSMTKFTRDPAALRAARVKLARLIEDQNQAYGRLHSGGIASHMFFGGLDVLARNRV